MPNVIEHQADNHLLIVGIMLLLIEYHLSPGSPAIDVGSEVDIPLIDFDGSPRPVDSDGDLVPAADIGAFEFQLLTLYC